MYNRGNVDYICGEFAAVFDNCKLQWKTYKNDENNNAKIGYIVAPKTSPYVFRNCEVTTDGAHGDIAVLGKYGRTWGANSNASLLSVRLMDTLTQKAGEKCLMERRLQQSSMSTITQTRVKHL